MFFKSTAKRLKEIKEKEARIDNLERELFGLKEKVADLKQEKKELEFENKKSKENIQHMVRIKEEKMELAHQKRVQELEMEKIKEIASVKDAFRDKREEQLKEASDKLNEQYKALLSLMPNVNVRLKGGV